MSFRPNLLAPAFLALALGLSHPANAQAADGSVTKPDPLPIQLQVSPACAQPGGLLHVSIMASSQEYRSHMISSPEYRSAFFDIFFDARSPPSFFDIWYGDDLKTRPAFFDIFTEVTLGPGLGPVTLQKLSLVCGVLTPTSIELLMQIPTSGGGGGAEGTLLLRRGDATLASVPLMLMSSPRSPIQHTLGSGEAISSFFDIFAEVDLAGSGPDGAKRLKTMAHDDWHALQRACEAELRALRLVYSDDPTTSVLFNPKEYLRVRLHLAGDLLRDLQDALGRELLLDLKTRH